MVLFCYAQIQAQVSSGLVAKYSFNNGNANDESGNANHGSINDAVLTADRFGNANKAFQFAINQTITAPDASNIDGMTSALSISFWVKAAPSISFVNSLISKFSNCGGGADAYNISINGTGKIFTQIDDEMGFDAFQTGSVTIADNSWHHIVVVWNKPNVMIYEDGVADTNGTYTVFNSTISNSPNVLSFGQVIIDSCGVPFEYNEKLDDIRIYNIALNASQIDTLYNEPNPLSSSIHEANMAENSVAVYPNPSSDYIHIQLENYNGISYVLKDNKGAIVSRGMLDDADLNIEDLDAGFYALYIMNANHQIINTSKIVKL